ncbi:hypothetical protein MIPYR_30339 [uncultured Microbacterium sp.]|uniref:Uncharacterized protein n=1 Tax=uncultured Microbacterium sp. TaxID=191216 RepID=A0A1Y5P629_9MICO|nr:hypothetical protein MIPYR_30339 [uncultured Microbacterium sp.]
MRESGLFFIPSSADHGPLFFEPSEVERVDRVQLMARVVTRLRLIERSDPPELASPTREFSDVFGPW